MGSEDRINLKGGGVLEYFTLAAVPGIAYVEFEHSPQLVFPNSKLSIFLLMASNSHTWEGVLTVYQTQRLPGP